MFKNFNTINQWARSMSAKLSITSKKNYTNEMLTPVKIHYYAGALVISIGICHKGLSETKKNIQLLTIKRPIITMAKLCLSLVKRKKAEDQIVIADYEVQVNGYGMSCVPLLACCFVSS